LNTLEKQIYAKKTGQSPHSAVERDSELRPAP